MKNDFSFALIMAKPIQEIKTEHLEHLKKLIQEQFGKSILNANDCELLAAAIFETTSQRVHGDTMRRLYGILKSDSQPSLFTLDVCALFCHLEDWTKVVENYLAQNNLYLKSLLIDVVLNNKKSFDELKNELNKRAKSKDLYETFAQIILAKAQQEDKEFFERIFELKKLFAFESRYQYDIYHTIHLLGALCIKHAWLKKIAIKHYYNLPFAHDYFVEWLVLPEQDYYMALLKNYYNANPNKKAVALFYSLICATKNAEQKEWKMFLSDYKRIESMSVKPAAVNNLVAMRLMGVQLYHANKYDQEMFKKLLHEIEAIKFLAHLKDLGHKVSSVFMLCNYLHELKAFETIVGLYESKIEQQKLTLGYWAELNFIQLKVLYAAALYESKNKKKAKLIFKEIDIAKADLNFHFRIKSVYENVERCLK